MKEENSQLKENLKKIATKANDNEQYSRRNNIRIFGLQEDKSKSTSESVVNFLKHELDVDISHSEIDKAHPIGKSQDGKPPPLIVKFSNHRSKEKVLSRRRSLKGKRIFITEDLTKQNYQLLQAAKKHSSVSSCWSHNGKILAKCENPPRTIHITDLFILESIAETDVDDEQFHMPDESPHQVRIA